MREFKYHERAARFHRGKESSGHSFVRGRNDSVFVICDHASNRIPLSLYRLELGPEHLQTHIAYDIGAAETAKWLCRRFGCAGLFAGTSRLVVDLNRPLDHPGAMPEESGGVPIPGNRDLSEAERESRAETFYAPYHEALSAALDARPGTFVISVHSFTPRNPDGSYRVTDIGLLAKEDADGGDMAAARAFCAGLPPELVCDINKPYSAYDLNHTIDAHVIPRGLGHLVLEYRQDHVGAKDGPRLLSRWTHAALAPVLEARANKD